MFARCSGDIRGALGWAGDVALDVLREGDEGHKLRAAGWESIRLWHFSGLMRRER